MNTAPRYEKEDILINFRDMLLHIFLHWRSILVGVFVVTLLAGGGKYLLDYRDYKAQTDALATEDTTLDGMTMTNVTNALGYHRAYEAAVNYNNASPLMAIDYTAAPTMLLNFSVQSDHSYNTAVTLQSSLKDTAAANDDLAALVDIAYPPAYLAELISSSILYREEETVSSDAPVILQVKVLGVNEELCRDIADALVAGMSKVPGCKLQNTRYFVAVDTDLKTEQTANINATHALRNNYKSAKESLTAEESALLEKLIAGEQTDAPTQPTKPGISKKFVVLGFLTGGVLMVGFYGLGYVLNRKVKSREDVQERYGLYLFDSLTDTTTKKNPVDRWILRLFSKKNVLSAEETWKLLIQQVRLAAAPVCKAGGALVLTGSALTEEAHSRLQPLAAALEKEGIHLRIVKNPLQDAVAMGAVADAAGVILAETARVSTYEDIYKELDLCERLDKAVLGMILL